MALVVKGVHTVLQMVQYDDIVQDVLVMWANPLYRG